MCHSLAASKTTVIQHRALFVYSGTILHGNKQIHHLFMVNKQVLPVWHHKL